MPARKQKHRILCEYAVFPTKNGEVRVEQGEVTDLVPAKVANELVERGRIEAVDGEAAEEEQG